MRKKDLAYWGLEVRREILPPSILALGGDQPILRISAAVAFSLFAAVLFTLFDRPSSATQSKPESASERPIVKVASAPSKTDTAPAAKPPVLAPPSAAAVEPLPQIPASRPAFATAGTAAPALASPSAFDAARTFTPPPPAPAPAIQRPAEPAPEAAALPPESREIKIVARPPLPRAAPERKISAPPAPEAVAVAPAPAASSEPDPLSAWDSIPPGAAPPAFAAAVQPPANATPEAPAEPREIKIAARPPFPRAAPEREIAPAEESGTLRAYAAASAATPEGAPTDCLPTPLRTVLSTLQSRFSGVTIVSTKHLHTDNHSPGSTREKLHHACKAVDIKTAQDVSEVMAFLRSRPEVGGINNYRNGVIHFDFNAGYNATASAAPRASARPPARRIVRRSAPQRQAQPEPAEPARNEWNIGRLE